MTISSKIPFVDAYTGRSEPVVIDVSGGTALFSAPSATTPRRAYASMDDAVAALGPSLVCPYTGEILRPVRVEGQEVMFVGGWDPRRPVPRQEFLHRASMRSGTSDVPAEVGRVSPAADEPPAPVSREVPVTQEAIDVVLEATEGRKRRRGRGRR